MDINELYTAPAHEAGAELQVENPLTGEKTDCYIKLMGVDSKSYRDAAKKQQREMLKSLDDENYEIDELFLLVEATLGWRGFTDKGKEWKFSKDNARALYQNSPSIANQVSAFIHRRKNFTQG